MRRAAEELSAAGVESVAVCFLFSYLNPDHEDRARGDPRAPHAAGLHHHLVVGRAAVPRVRAVHHGRAVGLHRTEDRQLHQPSRKRLARAGPRRGPADHGVERRRRDPRDGGREAGAHAAVGYRGRRARRRLDRAIGRADAADHLRYRRHQRRHRDRGRRADRRDGCALGLDRGISAAAADDRRSHDRRRRRIDRACRSWRRVSRRPAQCGRGSRPRRLWPRRHRADRHRCECRARTARSAGFSRRRDDARPGRRRIARSARSRRSWDSICWRPPKAS